MEETASGEIDTDLFGNACVVSGEAVSTLKELLHHYNLHAAAAKCVCSDEADVMVGSVSFCKKCSAKYHPQRPLVKIVTMCPSCPARIVTGTVLNDTCNPCEEASQALHTDAVEAHEEICPNRPFHLCDGVTASNIHEHACANPFCPLSEINRAMLRLP